MTCNDNGWIFFWQCYKLAKLIGDNESARRYQQQMEPWNTQVQPDRVPQVLRGGVYARR